MDSNKTAQEKFNRLRQQAETLIKANDLVEISVDFDDPVKLIHELQTFQIELEVQNEELRRSQQELIQSQTNYTELYDFAPVGYITTNLKGIILRANLTLADMLKTKRVYLINQPLSAFIPIEYQDIHYYHLKNLSELKTRQTSELQLRPKDGTLLYVHMESTVILNKVGVPEQYGTIIIDISERKRVEKILTKSEEKYRSLTQVSPSGIWRTDSNGMNTYVSKRWSEITGISAIKALNRGWSNGIHPDDMQTVANEWFAHAKTHKPYRSEYRFIKPNKDIIWVLCIATRISDQKGWVGTITDITDRKSAEKALQKSHNTLEEKVDERTKSLEDMNAALTVLLKKREQDKHEIEQKVLLNYKLLISPFLEKLKNSLSQNDQKSHMMILESNLKEFIAPFSKKLSDPLVDLTPAEIQLASMIKQGLSSKEMAEVLNISIRTITNHRQHIRTKLGLKNKKINLRSYLSSI